MNIQQSFGGEIEVAARRLIEQAGTILRGLRDVPESFAPLLFGQASPEDIARYEARELADLAEAAWLFLQDRRLRLPKVRLESRTGPIGAEAIKSVSIIELINDDMPFLLDSIMGELAEQGLDVRLVVHPIFTVERDHTGALIAFRGDGPAVGAARRESFIHIHVERIEDPARRERVVTAIEQMLGDVRACVQDWRPMLARVGEVIAEIKNNPPPLPVDEIAEAAQFLEWLVANNFTFLGLREYVIGEGSYEARQGTGLGVLRDPDVHVLRRGGEAVALTPEIMAFLREPKALIITKANARSRVHRRVHLDYIGVKRFGDDGGLIGELRIVGLFTSTAYTRSTRSIPYLRRKVDTLVQHSGFDPDSHSGKAFATVLETYPRDELFQIDEDTLFEFALAIMRLDERPRVRVLPRRDRFGRYVSVLVYAPRERYDSSIRVAIGNYLAKAYHGRISTFYPFFPEGPLVRVHFIVARDGDAEGEMPDPARTDLEHAVEEIVRSWTDGLVQALVLVHDTNKVQQLVRRYRDAFPLGYREAYSPQVAVGDIRQIEALSPIRPLGADFYSRGDGDKACAGLKVWSRENPIPLSERVPVLENMGFRVVDERTYEVKLGGPDVVPVWLHDMMLERADGQAFELEILKSRLEAAFMTVMRGRAENDGYNALVLMAGLQWRDVALLRTISRFLRQTRLAYSQDYMWTTLRRHADMAGLIAQLFHLRFDPRLDASTEDRAARATATAAEIETALGAVESLDEDRILRHFLNAVTSALRTSFYQLDRGGQPKGTIAIKFESHKLIDLPLPRPLYEIFVYSPRVEGVHLRFGKVARGGLRWSDRPQDFRTEVLGLVKAQQVKNAVIVPVGAKGGFVPKQLPSGPRDAIQAEGTAAYTLFVSSLLDITDNLGTEGIIAPDSVVRYDGDDPYLVVAADKGTATFSDTANGISADYHFWLGDAFASGGSAGYDHKKMGITARGAWEAVRRHFREMDVDIRVTPFTVAGVGDMSGDVFGNGMLREKTIKLVAAFDHRDIFIDPDPDPERAFNERARLFDLSRSSWQDYNRDYISAGGGIYSRSAKEITLSIEARTMLGLTAEKVTPQEVMRAILKIDTDLLWFGGIGTYIRSSAETDEAAGDRVNDAIRITGADLRCKVIGEGANLGMTQRGRIEAAMRGIRLNTDAIDNSAGVNTSDVEVNIKVALAVPLRDGSLSLEGRDKLLTEMTDDVAALVLRNNYQQTLSLSLAQRRGMEDLGFEQRLMQVLETHGQLDREVEFLPSDMELGERRRRGQALTRPELSVLLAYAKLSLNNDLLGSSVPDDPYLARELVRYFPQALVERFPEALQAHRLRREIIATQLTNSIINRGGPSVVVRIADQTGAAPATIAAAFFVVRNSYDMIALNSAIDALDTKISGKLQLDLYAAVQDLLLDRIVWFVRNVDLSKGLADVVEHYKEGIATVTAALDTVLTDETKRARSARIAELTGGGVPQELAERIASLPSLAMAPDVILVANRTAKPVTDVATTYFAVGAFFQLDRIANAARGIQVTDYFDRLALDRALDSIGEAERRLTAEMVGNGTVGPAAVDVWVKPRSAEVERIRSAVHGIASSGLTLSKLSVAASLLGDLVKH